MSEELSIVPMTYQEPSGFEIENQKIVSDGRLVVGKIVYYALKSSIKVSFVVPEKVTYVSLSPDVGTQPQTVSIEYEGSSTGEKAKVL